jgi:hypothetical protein
MGVVLPMPGVRVDGGGREDPEEAQLQPNLSLAKLLRSLADMAEEGRIVSAAIVTLNVDGDPGRFTANVTDALVGQISRLQHMAHVELDKAEDVVYRT